MTKRNLSDTLSNLIGEAATDMRAELVDRAWFGRNANGDRPATYQEMLHGRYSWTTTYSPTNFYGPANIHGPTTIYGPREAKPKELEPEKPRGPELDR